MNHFKLNPTAALLSLANASTSRFAPIDQTTALLSLTDELTSRLAPIDTTAIARRFRLTDEIVALKVTDFIGEIAEREDFQSSEKIEDDEVTIAIKFLQSFMVADDPDFIAFGKKAIEQIGLQFAAGTASRKVLIAIVALIYSLGQNLFF